MKEMEELLALGWWEFHSPAYQDYDDYAEDGVVEFPELHYLFHPEVKVDTSMLRQWSLADQEVPENMYLDLLD